MKSLILLLALVVPSGGPTYDVPPPTGSPAADRATIQAIFDDGADYARNNSTPALARFPPGFKWLVDRELILNRRYVTVEGAGPFLSRIAMAGGSGRDVIVMGVDPTPGGVSVGPESLPDSFGVLDTTAAAVAGSRRGIRTRSAVHLAQAGGGFDQADYPAAKGLLVEMMADLSALPDSATASLCGLADQGPRPWSLCLMRGSLQLYLRTRDPLDPGQGVVRRWSGPVLPRGPVRVTLWVDLQAGSILLWVDGERAAINPANAPLAPGDTLAAGDGAHFGLGGFGRSVAQTSDVYGGPADISYHGLRVGTACPYDPSSAVLARKDGGAVNDAYRYFREGPDLIGSIPGTDSPGDVAKSRVVTVNAGNPSGGKAIPTSSYLLDDKGHLNPFGGCAWSTVRGLGVDCTPGQPYGDAIKAGGLTHCRFEDLDLRGGARGLALFNWGSTYTLSGRDLYLAGRQCGLHLFGVSSAKFEGLNFCFDAGTGYRSAVCMIDSQATIEGLFSPHVGTPLYGAYCRRSSPRLVGWQLDQEGPGGSRIADVWASPGEDSGMKSEVVLEDWVAANHDPGASALVLDGPAAGSGSRGQVGDCSVRAGGFCVIRSSPLRSLVRTTPAAAGLWRDAGSDWSASPGRNFSEGPALSPTPSQPSQVHP